MKTFEEFAAECPLVAILRGIKPEETEAVCDALYDGGVQLLEITLNTPNAFDCIDRAVKHVGERQMVGAGTVLTPEEVTQVAAHQGKFIISPNTDVSVIRRTKELGLVSVPGFLTATEAFTAMAAGADYLKWHFAAQESLPLYLVGSGLPSIRALVGKSKTYAERMFNYSEIGALSKEDVDLAITVPLNNNGLDIEPDAIAEVFESTRGYPYFLQEYGYQIWNIAEKSPISARDVRRIAPNVQQRLDTNFFDVRFDRISNREKEFLRAMAEFPQDKAIAMSDVAERMGRPQSAISPVRSSLIRKGMV